MGNEKKGPWLFRVYYRWFSSYPLYIGIVSNYYKDPNQTRIQWKGFGRVFFLFSVVFKSSTPPKESEHNPRKMMVGRRSFPVEMVFTPWLLGGVFLRWRFCQEWCSTRAAGHHANAPSQVPTGFGRRPGRSFQMKEAWEIIPNEPRKKGDHLAGTPYITLSQSKLPVIEGSCFKGHRHI